MDLLNLGLSRKLDEAANNVNLLNPAPTMHPTKPIDKERW